MDKLKVESTEHTSLFAVGEDAKVPGLTRIYAVLPANHDGAKVTDWCASVRFQSGLVEECGVNGCFNEDLLHIVLDRLRQEQKGNGRRRENLGAIIKISAALAELRS